MGGSLRRGLGRLMILALAALVACIGPAVAGAAAGEADRAMLLLDQGEFAAAAGNFDRAQEFWKQAQALRPDWPKAQERLRDLPARRAGYPQHIEEIRLRQKASLDFVEGVELFNQGRYQEAAARFQSVLQVQTGHALAGQYLAQARAQAQISGHGSLRVEANLPARVYLDGELKGATPLLLQNLPAGSHELVAEAQGVRVSRQVLIKGRSAHTTTFAFQEIEGP